VVDDDRDTPEVIAPGVVRARWWHVLPNGKVQCDLCPRGCRLKDGQRGFCFVRENRGGQLVMTSWGRASGFCVDPIEKKPLNHFYPGSSILSFGTAGCNLGCRFCQNWDLSHASKVDRLQDWALPEDIAEAAARAGCKSVAFTYNEPIIFAEFAIETAKACRRRGIKTVAVTAGYISAQARPAFFGEMDAANVDLKAFSERFYRKLCFAHLEPVLDTLAWIRRASTTWLEVTTLVVPGENDDPDELRRLSAWCASHLGTETPLHFTAYHPAFQHATSRPTPASTLALARAIAREEGMKHVYTGNVHDASGQSTYCAGCGALLIERSGYHLGAYRIDRAGRCEVCARAVAGWFDAGPGGWGAQRRRLQVG
jgi:pyruvate formate lyase activating enzyme